MVIRLIAARPAVGSLGLRQSLFLELHVGLKIDGRGFDRLDGTEDELASTRSYVISTACSSSANLP